MKSPVKKKPKNKILEYLVDFSFAVVLGVIVPADAAEGQYTVPVQVDAKAVGNVLTTSGWVTFTVQKPAPQVGADVETVMTWVFVALLVAVIAYAFLKKE